MTTVKKGDEIIEVCLWGDGTNERFPEPSVYISDPMVVQSMGKKQGTAMRPADGFIKIQIYPQDIGRIYFKPDDTEGIFNAVQSCRDGIINRLKSSVELSRRWQEEFRFKASGVVMERSIRETEREEKLISDGPKAIKVFRAEGWKYVYRNPVTVTSKFN